MSRRNQPRPRPRREQSRADLLEHLRENLGWLLSSCRAYDTLSFAESKRIAATLRTLLHHAEPRPGVKPSEHPSESLFRQLDVSSSMLFEDSCGPLHANLVARSGALAIPSTNPAWGDYVPLYERRLPGPGLPVPPKRFDEWWREPIIRDGSGRQFTRKKFVLALANQDGGTHVASKLDGWYAEVSRANSVGFEWSDSPDGPWLDATSPVPASVRQVGHELIRSCQLWLPEALTKIGASPEAIERALAPLANYTTPWNARPDDAAPGARPPRA